MGSFVWDTIAGLFRCSVSVLVKVLGGFSSPASLYFDLRIRGHPQISSILPDDMQIPIIATYFFEYLPARNVELRPVIEAEHRINLLKADAASIPLQ